MATSAENGLLPTFEPQQRAHIQIRLKVLTVEDSQQLAAGFFNFRKCISITPKIGFQHNNGYFLECPEARIGSILLLSDATACN
jgi:hypothetical protein